MIPNNIVACATCAECDEIFVRTTDKEPYFVCPNGHGKLVPLMELQLRVAQVVFGGDVNRRQMNEAVLQTGRLADMIKARQRRLWPRLEKKAAEWVTEEALYGIADH